MPPGFCRICDRSFMDGHASGCENGPQIGSRTIPIGETPDSLTHQPMTAMEIARRQQEDNERINQQMQGIFGRGATEALVAIQNQIYQNMINPPVIQARPITDWIEPVEAPRTSADIAFAPRVRHVIDRLDGGLQGGVVYRCSCGWQLTRAYLDGLSEYEIRGLVDAHLAGGSVGPAQTANAAGRIPYTEIAKPKIPWETPHISEPALSPRREIRLEDA